MAKRKQYPQLAEGTQVRLNHDVMFRPLLYLVGGVGYGEPYVYVESGSIGTVGAPFLGDTYRVYFDSIRDDGPLALHAASLEVIEENEVKS